MVFYVRIKETVAGRQNPYWGHVGVFSSKEKAIEGIEHYKKLFPERKTSFVIMQFPVDIVYAYARHDPIYWSEGLTREEREQLFQ